MVKRRVAIPVIAAALLVLGLLAWLRAGDSDAAGDAGEVVAVAPRTVSATVVAVGAVKPRIGSEVRVGSRISGRVWKLRANIGDRVERGQIIAELETAEVDALIAQRRAELKLAEAKLAAFATLSPEEEARARADVRRFEAEVTLVAEEPKLKPHYGELSESLQKLFSLPEGRVSLKAKSNEGLGEIGKGEAIACYAVATVALP